MQVLRDEGVATHIGPEPCVPVREGRGEASVGVCVGQPSSGDSNTVRSVEGVPDPEDNTGSLAIARGCLIVATGSGPHSGMVWESCGAPWGARPSEA